MCQDVVVASPSKALLVIPFALSQARAKPATFPSRVTEKRELYKYGTMSYIYYISSSSSH